MTTQATHRMIGCKPALARQLGLAVGRVVRGLFGAMRSGGGRSSRPMGESLEPRMLLTTVYVDDSAAGLNNGSGWANAYTSLQTALSQATLGQEIHVGQGTYKPAAADRNASFQLKNGVSMLGGYAGYGAGNPDDRNVAYYATVLSGDIGSVGNNSDNSYHVVVGSGTDGSAILDGFTITDGYSNDVGGGLYNSAGSPTVRNCVFVKNTATNRGGAIYNAGSSAPILTNCIFTRNTSTSTSSRGGAVYNDSSSPVFTNCVFNGNSCAGTSNAGGGAMYSDWGASQPKLINCTFVGNRAVDRGGAIFTFGGAATLTNCTFVSNSTTGATGSGGAINNSASSPTLVNCILWGNTAVTGSQINSGGTVTYSDIQGGWTGTGNLNADPRFVSDPSPGVDGIWGTTDDVYGDLRLQGTSPAVDAGNNNSAGLSGISTDLAGKFRFADVSTKTDTGTGTAPIVDMGAYEVVSGLVASAGGPYVVIWGQSVTLNGLGSSDVPGALSYAWDWSGDGNFDDAIGANPDFSTSGRPVPSTITVSLRVTDASSQSTIGTSTIRIVPAVLYVDDNAGGLNDGSNWTNAFTSLQTALAQSTAAGQEIHVGQGTYKPAASDRNASFQLTNGVSVLGGYAGFGAGNPDARNVAGYVTSLSGDIGTVGSHTDNSYHVVLGNGTDRTAILDGFIIAAGNANGTNPADRGAGMYSSGGSPTVRNCTFAGNIASTHGGGAFNDSSSSPGFTNCIFVGNSAINYYGGGMYSWFSSPTLTNCTFTGNTAVSGGAITTDGAPTTVTNCIVWGNSPQNGNQLYNKGGSATVTYSDSQDGYTGTGNINADPLFVRNPSSGGDATWGTADDDYGDLRLQITSPAVDAGNNNAAGLFGISTDLAGDNRFVNEPAKADAGAGTAPIVDMGAYETASDLVGISGILWHDVDRGGVKDVGETALSNWTIYIDANNNGLLDAGEKSTTTDAKGRYMLASLAPGASYVVRQILPANWECIVPVSGAYAFTPSVGQLLTADFGNSANPCQIQGAVWNDVNHNGSRDGGESGLSGWTVYLDANNNGALDAEELTATTDANGNYSLSGLSPSVTYTVREVVSTGWRRTAPASGSYSFTPNPGQILTADFGSDIPLAIYVDDNAGGLNNGSSWANAYTSLQTALSQVTSGQEIHVGQGTYKPAASDRNTSFQLKNGVSVLGGYSGYGAGNPDDRNVAVYATILSGDIGTVGSNTDNSYHVVVGSGTNNTAIMDGFTITAGYATDSGGGMYNSSGSPTINNCTFSANTASKGGGMYNNASSPILTNCVFVGNLAIGGDIRGGGGIFDESGSSPTLTNCSFIRNAATLHRGGGIYNYSDCSPKLTNCYFAGNTAGDRGGGMFSEFSSSPVVVDCVFVGNTAALGGGVYTLFGSPTYTNSTFVGNVANSTAVTPVGGGIYNHSCSATVTNCIVWGNSASTDPQIYPAGSGANTYSDIQGGWTGTGNINVDPLFVRNPSPGADGIWGTTDDDYGDLRLQSTSPAVDAGNNNAAGLPGVSTDVGGNSRFADISTKADTGVGTAPIVDMGSYEVRLTSADLCGISGILWHDADGNGVKNGSEGALSGWTVYIDANNNSQLDAGEKFAVTGANGDYTLANLSPLVSYAVRQVMQSGWECTFPVSGTYALIPDAGQTLVANFGNATQTIVRGSVWNDANGNAIRDIGESGLSGWTAFVDSDGNGTLDAGEPTAVTDANGSYDLNTRAPGTHTVRLISQTGWKTSFPASAQYSLTIAPGETATAWDFGIYYPIVVSTLLDEQDGDTSANDLSLREALMLAAAAPGQNIIDFAPSLSGVIELSPVLLQLTIDSEVTIRGPGAPQLAIEGGSNARVFYVAGVRATLTNLTVQGGLVNNGAGLYAASGSQLTLDRMVFASNFATSKGGAIYCSASSDVSISNSVVQDNTTSDLGGGIYNAGTLGVSSSTISGNTANGTLSTRGRGGGLWSSGILAVSNATIYGNSATLHGGGLYAEAGTIQMTNLTIASNRADSDGKNGGDGGGLYNSLATLLMYNSAVADNFVGTGQIPDDLYGFVASGSAHNFIGTGNGATGIANGTNANQVGSDASPLNPQLRPLADYGGNTPTVATLAGSVLIDTGSNTAAMAAGLVVDQRGQPRLADFSDRGTATVDIGAYEASRLILVNGAKDELADTDGLMSLREALAMAALNPGLDTIQFAPSLTAGGAGTLLLTQGELLFDSDVDVQGPATGSLTVDAGGASRVLRVVSGVSALISNLSLANGSAFDGGGINNAGMLQLRGMLLRNSLADGSGGGIYNSGSVDLAGCTLSANSANISGGGIYNAAGSVTVTNLTIVENLADADDNGSGSGGGMAVGGGSVSLANSVVAGNAHATTTPAADDVNGVFNNISSYNFIGSIDGSTGLGGIGTQYGSVVTPADPKVLPLADNGGATLTHGLQPASPLTDGGNNALAEAVGLIADARGLPRVKDGNDDGLARIDIGAFEQQYPLNQAPILHTAQNLHGAIEGVAFAISNEYLLSRSDAVDPELASLGFKITAITSGILTLNGQPVSIGTLLLPGQSLVWTPPAIDFAGLPSKTIPAFTMAAWDGQVASNSTAMVSIEVVTVAQPTNYAVLFSGGDSLSLNYSTYYDNLKRLYGVLVNQYGLEPCNIYVVYADGRDMAADIKGGINSDMSFAQNVLSATKTNLRDTLESLSTKIDANDHFFFWAFDHGMGTPNKPAVYGEEILKGWGTDQTILSNELRVWLQGLKVTDNVSNYPGITSGYSGIRAGATTYVFNQCYGGGFLDDLASSATVFGAAAANHYEVSYSDYFAAAFTDALALGYNQSLATFQYAFQHDGQARSSPTPNGGSWQTNVEHPWSSGGDLPIFALASNQNAAPELHKIIPLEIPTSQTDLEISYDMMMAASDAADPTGQAVVFYLDTVDVGQVYRNGALINLGIATQRKISFGDKITWRRPAGSTGTISALRFKVLDYSGNPSGTAVVASVRIGDNPQGPHALADTKPIRQNNHDVLINVLGNDLGVGLRVIDIGVASHGQVTLDSVTGQVRYTPAAEYLGDDVFTYAISDGLNTHLAQVKLTMVSFDPDVPVGTTVRYQSTELPPPPGWAGLPDEWVWSFRDSISDWVDTYAVDIGDDGTVVVRTQRLPTPLDPVGYVGGATAGYRWYAGDAMEPYWNYAAVGTGVSTASNTFMLLKGTGAMHNGKEIYAGVEALAAGSDSTVPGYRYLVPDNADEQPRVGGVWFDLGTDQDLWQDLPQDMLVVNVFGGVSNSGATYHALLLNSSAFWGAAHAEIVTLEASAEVAGEVQILASQELWGWGGGGTAGSIPAQMNGQGHAVGHALRGDGLWHAFYYNGATMVDLGTSNGLAESAATAINSLNQVIGYSTNSIASPGSRVAFTWDATKGMRSLGTLSGGWSEAYDINDAGVIVGASDGHAVVWIDGVIHDLNALADGLPTGAVLYESRGINASGQVVATATLSGGRHEAFYLDVKGILTAADDTVATGSHLAINFNALSNDTGARSVVSVNTGSLLGTLTWDATGAMKYDPGTAFGSLGIGQTATTSFTYTVENGQGGPGGTATATVTITVTGQPLGNLPPAPMQLAAGSDSGVAGDRVTQVLRPTLTGQANPSALVKVYDGGVYLGQTTAGTDGTYAFQPLADLAEGSHTVSATQDDAQGHASDFSSPLKLLVISPVNRALVLSGSGGADNFTLRTQVPSNNVALYQNDPLSSPATFVVALSEFDSVVVQGAGGLDTLSIEGGNIHISNDAGMGTGMALSLTGGAMVTFSSHQHLSSLAIADGCTASLSSGVRKILRTGALSLTGFGKLDLASGDLVVGLGNIDIIANLIASARNASPQWGGAGITSSAAAIDSRTGLSLLNNDKGDGTPVLTTLDGQPVAAGEILVKYSYNGDSNLSGTVDADDYFAIDSAFLAQSTGHPPSQPRHSDFDYSGRVDGDDYFLIDAAFMRQGQPMQAVVSRVATPVAKASPLSLPPQANAAMLAGESVGIMPRVMAKASVFSDEPVRPLMDIVGKKRDEPWMVRDQP